MATTTWFRKFLCTAVLLAAVSFCCLYIILAVLRGVQASRNESAIVASHMAACDYLCIVILDGLTWPTSSCEFEDGISKAISARIITDPGIPILTYIKYCNFEFDQLAGLQVCDPSFPIQSPRLSCSERKLYGGEKLLTTIQNHYEYFERMP